MGGFGGVGWVGGGSGIAFVLIYLGEMVIRVWMGIFVRYKHTIYKKGTIIQIRIQIRH